MVQISKHPTGPQLTILGKRVHHFHFGLAALALGAYLIVSDKRDFGQWLLHG